MNNPLVTVAMVTYNSSQTINEAIDSVLASTYTNFELLICDDHSTDNTLNIIQQYNDNRIVAFRHELNLGEYNNRNFCLKHAKGKYIIYIDGDDLIKPNGLEVFVKQMESHTDCGIAISRPYSELKAFTPVEVFRRHYLSNDTMLNLALVRVLFNREKFLSLGGFSNQYRSGDDYARMLMAANCSVLIIEDGLVWWRQSKNSASDKLFNSYRGIYEPLAIKYSFLNSTNLLNNPEKSIAKKRLNKAYCRIVKMLIKKGKVTWLLQLLLNYRRIKQLGKS
ncbi:glycosyltransferase family 2 protein [Carboxylicivirga marina]|uniref:glycosyltransferase family 2 protein n=1 Tax=Carboxylicivirga marina TaxID=2800988 RepID=UPI002598CD7A|nr:glycosyltransferase family A protein [uncultured Carboxylicivirga sp.]